MIVCDFQLTFSCCYIFNHDVDVFFLIFAIVINFFLNNKHVDKHVEMIMSRCFFLISRNSREKKYREIHDFVKRLCVRYNSFFHIL